MNLYATLQFAIFLVVLLALAKPLGEYLGKVLERDATPLDRLVGPIERFLYRLGGITGNDRMDQALYILTVINGAHARNESKDESEGRGIMHGRDSLLIRIGRAGGRIAGGAPQGSRISWHGTDRDGSGCRPRAAAATGPGG